MPFKFMYRKSIWTLLVTTTVKISSLKKGQVLVYYGYYS